MWRERIQSVHCVMNKDTVLQVDVSLLEDAIVAENIRQIA
jgi:hypothetical protein